jgi:CHAT domain-containing protein/tetratricopeptide (TPR) repeat protein
MRSSEHAQTTIEAGQNESLAILMNTRSIVLYLLSVVCRSAISQFTLLLASILLIFAALSIDNTQRTCPNEPMGREDGFTGSLSVDGSSTELIGAAFGLPKFPRLTDRAANIDRTIEIAAGSLIRGGLSAGGEQLFEISVDAGKLLRFSIDKGDLALSTVLYGPTGTALLEHISQDFEVVEISFPALVTGIYTIEIQSRESADQRREYELNVQSFRTVTPLHRKDSEARRAMARAQVLRSNWTQTSLRQAREEYETAALIWRSASDFANASTARLKTGDMYFLFSEYGEALKQYQNAEAFATEAGDWLARVRALSHMGRLQSYVGNNNLAQELLTKALHFFEQHEPYRNAVTTNAYGEVLSNLAEVSYAKGDFVKSSKRFELAIKALQNDRKGEAKAHLFAGYMAGSIGLPEKAVADLSVALHLSRTIDDKIGEGLALTALGLSYSLDRDEIAIELHHQAIQIFHSIGDRHSEAIALNALGQAFENLGDYSLALTNYDNGFRLFQEIGASDGASVTAFKLAKLHHLSGHPDQALAYYERCLRLSRAARKVRTEANALNEIAKVYAALGRPKLASKQLKKIQKFYESIGDLRGQATTLNAFGNLLFQLGQKKKAIDTYRRALPLSEKASDPGILISTLYNLASAHFDLGYPAIALPFIQRSLRVIEDLRANIASPDFRLSYFSGVQNHYALCIEILMQLDRLRSGEGFSAEGLVVSEKSRARLLLDLVTEPGSDLLQGASKDLVERERELRGLFRSQAQYRMDLSLNKGDSTELARVEDQMLQLRAEYQEVQARLRQANPHQFSFEQFKQLDLEQIQHELRDSDTILLEYALGDERSYLWAVTSDSLHSYELPARKVLEDAARELYLSMTVRQGINGQIDDDYQANVETAEKLGAEKATNLSQTLLGPLAEQLGTRRLLVVTEGALQLIPFDALPVPVAPTANPKVSNSKRLLLETNEVVVLPSISTLIASRRAPSHISSTGKLIALMADPVFSINDDRVQSQPLSPSIALAAIKKNPEQSVITETLARDALARLGHASEEADEILATAPWGTTMMAKGFDATRELAMDSDVAQYQIVHFATHGFLDTEHPELSGIVLTMVDRNGVKRNGLMTLHDIYSLDLSSELTVLSACQTALGKQIKGEGLVGLTHSFMAAGAKTVIASLWKVDDRATAILMSDLYHSMLQDGMSPGASLRSAKLKLMRDKRWSAPYYWAGFVLQGEYANRISIDRHSRLNLGFAFLFFLILITASLLLFQKRARRFSLRQST